jgi:hypothetical protein
MCCHGNRSLNSMQRGLPLDDKRLGSMDKTEHAFWIDFLEETKQAVAAMRDAGSKLPYTPSDSLKAKYLHAIIEYNGEQYCQVQQIKELFGF